jgi:hypothetical protein
MTNRTTRWKRNSGVVVPSRCHGNVGSDVGIGQRNKRARCECGCGGTRGSLSAGGRCVVLVGGGGVPGTCVCVWGGGGMNFTHFEIVSVA